MNDELVWVLFYQAAIQKTETVSASYIADLMLEQYKNRFKKQWNARSSKLNEDELEEHNGRND